MAQKQHREKRSRELFRIVVQGKANWRCACGIHHPLNRYRCKKCRMQAPHVRSERERVLLEIEDNAVR